MVGASLSQPPLSQPAKWSKTSACGDVDMVYQLPPDPGLHTREVRLGCIGGRHGLWGPCTVGLGQQVARAV